MIMPTMEPTFIHLRVHSEFSLVDGIVRIKPLITAVRDANMPAVAVTDQSNLFSMVKFYRAAIAGGIKPIIGADCWLQNEQDVNQPNRLLLLVQTSAGYRNLTRLISKTFQEGQHLGRPMLYQEWLHGNCDGLIALSGGRDGDVGRQLVSGHKEQARELLERWIDLFGDRYYLEVNRTGRPMDEDCLHASVELSIASGVPLVATNDVRFLKHEDFDSHEVRVCIHGGRTLDDPRRPKNYSPQQYLRSQEEMVELFSDLPEALANSVEIAKRCSLELTLGENYLPEFPVPEGMTVEQFTVQEAERGLNDRLQKILDQSDPEYAEKRKQYDERLKLELCVITQMGFPGYFLIVADFIRWARENDVPVGPGRGSGAGSLVAYVLRITDLDPIEHDLLFERFLNPERVSMPDFDVDFCMEGRDRVIEYVADTYGRDSVSQIITYGTMAAKAVVRDVGRVLGHPYGFVDRIAKLIPFEIGMTLAKAMEENEELNQAYKQEDGVSELIDMAMSLEGLSRNAGKHAGGVVIAPTVLTDFTPLYCEASGENLVTQFDKDDVEAVGLVKFDFLGLRTLTIVDWALKTINARRKEEGETEINITKINMDDKPAFDLLKSCRTTAVFQLESRGMKDLIKKLQPDSFDDITALVALFRPGPLQSGMVDDFINRKHGRQRVEYPHPALEPILNSTYGVILYQEQVMQIAQVLAGYTLGGADILRRAMGKKKPEEMAKQGEIFRKGAVDLGVEEDTASYIFDLMEKFAGYGFNKSHSAAYALVSYHTLWLKAHYPAAFMAAVLSADMDHTDKVVIMVDECNSMQLKVNPPHVNHSEYRFTINGSDTVIYGLGAIKGVGESAIESIIQERASNGIYQDLFQFCRRVDLRKANRRVLESLIRSGAMDELGTNRATLMSQLPLALKMAEQHHATQAAGQNDMFGMSDEVDIAVPDQIIPDPSEEWDEQQRLQGEKETLGLYLTGHPINRYLSEFSGVGISRISDLSLDDGSGFRGNGRGKKGGVRVMIAGLVISSSHRMTQRGRMGTVLLDDSSARMEVTLFSEAYEEFRELLTADKILVVTGNLNYDEYRGGLSIRADQVLEFEQARALNAKAVQLDTVGLNGAVNPELLNKVHGILNTYKGGNCSVRLRMVRADSHGIIEFGDDWKVTPTDELLRRLERLFDTDGVEMIYGNRP